MNTIAAISTPNAVGGIAMIRISGEDAIAAASKIFIPAGNVKVTEMRGYTCAYGWIADGDRRLDDVVLTVFRAPHSYTGEDTVEITCHGGIFLSKQILSLLLHCGCEPAGAGEFTKRAFLNGKLSLSQAEAVMDVIRADGDAVLRQANLAKQGKLHERMFLISERLVDMMSAFAYWLDDAEEMPPELERSSLLQELSALHAELRQMSADYQNGRILREGIRTVLLGRPNAGKSSVMNWLCGMQRSIVTDIAGTTRDVITEQVKIGDFTLLLSDTAGLRETENAIESIGISQAYQALDTADFVIYVVDAAVGMMREDREILALCKGRPVLVLWNKTDLTDSQPPELDVPVLTISALHADSYAPLESQIKEIFQKRTFSDQPTIMNERQNTLILRAAERVSVCCDLLNEDAELDMIYAELEEAAHALREIDGDDVTDDVIEGVFSKFCVGK